MRNKTKKVVYGIACVIAMTALIFDAEYALLGAKDGVKLCLFTVIPALYPFCVLSIIFRSIVSGTRIKLLAPMERFCGIPIGSGIIFLIGVLGGYPVAAICIEQARKAGNLSDADAGRMAVFCNNAGPAFIFGMLPCLFNSFTTVIIIWIIQLVSAIIVGFILPNKSKNQIMISKQTNTTLKKALESASNSMVQVCSIVILFRVIITIISRWFLWLLTPELKTALIGIMELTNGVIELKQISSEINRMILSCALLSFGGLCVALQAVSISSAIKPSVYLLGKLLQCGISMTIAYALQSIAHPELRSSFLIIATITVITICTVKIIQKKKIVAIPA